MKKQDEQDEQEAYAKFEALARKLINAPRQGTKRQGSRKPVKKTETQRRECKVG